MGSIRCSPSPKDDGSAPHIVVTTPSPISLVPTCPYRGMGVRVLLRYLPSCGHDALETLRLRSRSSGERVCLVKGPSPHPLHPLVGFPRVYVSACLTSWRFPFSERRPTDVWKTWGTIAPSGEEIEAKG